MGEQVMYLYQFKCAHCGNQFDHYRKQRKNKPTKYCSKGCKKKGVAQSIKDTNLEKYGVSCIFQLESVKDQIKETCLEVYGVENPAQSEDVQNTKKATMLEKYGVVHQMHLDSTKDKMKETCLERYGVEYASSSPIVREKVKDTVMGIYGVDNVFKSQIIIDKIATTQIERYGMLFSQTAAARAAMVASYYDKSDEEKKEIQNKTMATNLERFGYLWATQNPGVAKRISDSHLILMRSEEGKIVMAKRRNSGYRSKPFEFPSGRTDLVQGYEDRALKQLLTIYHEDDIVTDPTKIPSITYSEDGKLRTYFPDIYIPKDNLIIEVKSNWTYNNQLSTNLLKADATRSSDYNFQFMIYDK